MKIKTSTQPEGSVLVISLLVATIVGVGLVSYLGLIAGQNYSVGRSQTWNLALPVAEAGLEEAFTHLNKDSNNLGGNSWSTLLVNGKAVYKKQRSLWSDGSYYVTMISNAPVAPVVYSQAHVPAPLRGGFITRALCVGSAKKGSAVFGLLTKNQLNLGSDFTIDSYNSNNGPYNATNNRAANADIGSMSTSAGQVMIADSDIYGHVYTTPSGSYTLGKAGAVGDLAFVSNPANGGKVQSGYYFNDLNVDVPDVPDPPGLSSWSTVTSGSITTNGVTYNYVLTTGNYKLGAGVTLKGKILILGQVNLYIPSSGRIQFGSGDVISIPVSANSTFAMYNASTTDVVMKDVSNDSLIPSRFTYYGMPTTAGSKITLTGSGAYAYAGVIYAPNQNMVLTGSNGENEDFLGAVTVNNFTMSGHTYMHFDEALKNNNGGSPVLSSYAEIPSYPEY